MSGSPIKSKSPAAHRPTVTRAGGGFDDPLCYWINNRPIANTKPSQNYAGWVVECGKHEALDQALVDAQHPTVVIKHTTAAVKYWAFETPVLYVICAGIPDRNKLVEADVDHLGIRYWWGPMGAAVEGEKQREGTHIQFRALIKDIAYPQIFTFTAKGKTMTNALLNALYDHYRVLDALNAARKQEHPYFMAGMALMLGEEQLARGGNGKASPVLPPVSGAPEEITGEYLKAVWIGKQAWVDVIDRAYDETIAWSNMVFVPQAQVEEGE